jgi:hypothetical protein
MMLLSTILSSPRTAKKIPRPDSDWLGALEIELEHEAHLEVDKLQASSSPHTNP